MTSRKSPGGSIFPYPYKGGELHCLKYGGFGRDEEALCALMRAEEAFLEAEGRCLPVWIDFYETRQSGRVLDELEASLQRMADRIHKLAIVGCSFGAEFRLRRRWRWAGRRPPFPVQFFTDPEDAKTWLVSEEGSL